MMLKMDAAMYVPGDCNAEWKRSETGWDGKYDAVEDTEIIDGVEYPMLPPGFASW